MAKKTLPPAERSHIHVNEVRAWVKADAAPRQAQRRVAKIQQLHARQADVDGLALHMQTVLCHAGCVRSQKFVRGWRPVTADHLNLSVGCSDGQREVGQQIEQARIEMMDRSRQTIAQETIELDQSLWKVALFPPINQIQMLAGVQMKQAKSSFLARLLRYVCWFRGRGRKQPNCDCSAKEMPHKVRIAAPSRRLGVQARAAFV